MKPYIVLIIFSLVFVFSCSKQTKKSDTETSVSDTIKQSDKKNINSIGVSLRPNTKKEIAGWKEYQLVDAILTNYYAISNAEALSNAQELSSLVISLKDSIRNKKLMTPSVNARINILHNECQRLNDMASIPAITPKEVTATITNILEAFSGLNAKLNTLYAVRDMENELDLDPDFQKILNDTTGNSLWDVKEVKEVQKEKSTNQPRKNLLNKKRLKSIKEKK